MKKQLSAVFVVVALICMNVLVHAQDDADIRRELEAQYKKLAAAHDRKDLKTIVAMKTSDFHVFFTDGRARS